MDEALNKDFPKLPERSSARAQMYIEHPAENSKINKKHFFKNKNANFARNESSCGIYLQNYFLLIWQY